MKASLVKGISRVIFENIDGASQCGDGHCRSVAWRWRVSPKMQRESQPYKVFKLQSAVPGGVSIGATFNVRSEVLGNAGFALNRQRSFSVYRSDRA